MAEEKIELKVGERYLVDQRETYYVEIEVVEISAKAVKVKYPSGSSEWVKKSYFDYNKVVEQLPNKMLQNLQSAINQPQDKR